ncbi:hypothetical protein [Dankookia sp. P2]|uniref:hypothetical protein n=1 Tax=Dankookia sp. P2 TaxID=3423955 RepID=UPI003D66DB77
MARIPEDGGPETLSTIIARYLSPAHRDAPGKGCTFAALGCEMPRQGAPVRRAFTEGLRARLAGLSALLPGQSKAREDRALALLAGMVGALILARAVDDPEFSDRILDATSAALQDHVQVE